MESYKDVFLALSGGTESLSFSSLQNYLLQANMNATEMECALALKLFLDSDDLTHISVDEYSSKEGLLEEMKNVSIDYSKFVKLIDFFLDDEKIVDDINETASRVYGSDVKILVDALKKDK